MSLAAELDVRPGRQRSRAPVPPAPLAFWLFRPYFDLGVTAPWAPLHAVHVHLAAASIDDARVDRVGPAMAMTPLFRSILVRESGLTAYACATPLDLPASVATAASPQPSTSSRCSDTASRTAAGAASSSSSSAKTPGIASSSNLTPPAPGAARG